MGKSKSARRKLDRQAVQGEPEFRARLSYAPMSARKMRLVADLVRGKNVNRALECLDHTPKRAAGFIGKLLKSAVHNADSSNRVREVDNLWIAEIRVDEGPKMKRWMPRAQGRASGVRHPRCHVIVALREAAK